MENLGAIFRDHPEIALFFTLAIGYVIGKIRVAGHDLGLVMGDLPPDFWTAESWKILV